MKVKKNKKGAVLAVVIFSLAFILILTTFILQLVAMGSKRMVKTVVNIDKNVLCEYIGNKFKTTDNLEDFKIYFNETKYAFNTEANILLVKNKDSDVESTDSIYKLEISDCENPTNKKLILKNELDVTIFYVEKDSSGNIQKWSNSEPQ